MKETSKINVTKIDFKCKKGSIDCIANTLEEVKNSSGVVGVPALKVGILEVEKIKKYARDNSIKIKEI